MLREALLLTVNQSTSKFIKLASVPPLVTYEVPSGSSYEQTKPTFKRLGFKNRQEGT